MGDLDRVPSLPGLDQGLNALLGPQHAQPTASEHLS